MADVAKWSLAELKARAPAPVAVCPDPSVAERVAGLLPWPQYTDFDALPADTQTLVAVGGGTLLDAAKIARVDRRPELTLIAIASLWGSGAEASPVAVARDGERKVARLEEVLAPDARVVLGELADGLSEALATAGCGDAWSHVFEAFLSPLGDDDIRAKAAALMADMLAVGVGVDARWFDLSARACALQARASVGLIHGIAHTLEGPLQAEFPDRGWGHARLCAVYLSPVLQLNSGLNDKWTRYGDEHRVDRAMVEQTFRQLHDAEAFAETLGLLTERWKQVLRDPLSRTNSALVRRGHLDHFVTGRFS